MKRSEVTTEKLKKLGYTAKYSFNSWYNTNVADCNKKQSAELFDEVVKAARTGKPVDIRRNNLFHTVNVYLEGAKRTPRGTEIVYFLSRPMSEAEVAEANMVSGYWVEENK